MPNSDNQPYPHTSRFCNGNLTIAQQRKDPPATGQQHTSIHNPAKSSYSTYSNDPVRTQRQNYTTTKTHFTPQASKIQSPNRRKPLCTPQQRNPSYTINHKGNLPTTTQQRQHTLIYNPAEPNHLTTTTASNVYKTITTADITENCDNHNTSEVSDHELSPRA